MWLVPPLPGRPGWSESTAVTSPDLPREPILDIFPKLVMTDQPGDLRSTRATLGMPLGQRGPILQPERAGGGVAAQLPRDRRRRAAQPAGDVPDADLLSVPDRDVLTLSKTTGTALPSPPVVEVQSVAGAYACTVAPSDSS